MFRKLVILFCFVLGISIYFCRFQIAMPGIGDPAKQSSEEMDSAKVQRLENTVRYLSVTIGERNIPLYRNLVGSSEYFFTEFSKLGLNVRKVSHKSRGKIVDNIEGILPGVLEKSIVIGAHIDSVEGTVGANDNASGAAALLEIAQTLAKKGKPHYTLRFVAFVNEEPPYYHTEEMGSLVYALKLNEEGVGVRLMLSLETMGYYTDEPDTQAYPFPLALFYPSTGNFVGFVSNYDSREELAYVIGVFREYAQVRSEGAALPSWLPGVGWSDHWSFWQVGWPGIMVTDTAPFRYPYYHTAEDTIDKIDFVTLAKVVDGLERTLVHISFPEPI